MSSDLTFITNEQSPHLLDEHNPGSWPNVFRELGVRGFLCESLGKLESLLCRE